MNLQNFKPVESSNPRGTSNLPSIGQIFTGIRYKKMETKSGDINAQFHVSNKMFEKENLDDYGYAILKDKESTDFVLLKVPNELEGQYTPKILRHRKNTKKGNKFKSVALEDALVAQDLIDPSDIKVNYYFQLEEVGELDGFKAYKVVADPDMSKGASPTGSIEEDEKEDEGSAESDADESVDQSANTQASPSSQNFEEALDEDEDL